MRSTIDGRRASRALRASAAWLNIAFIAFLSALLAFLFFLNPTSPLTGVWNIILPLVIVGGVGGIGFYLQPQENVRLIKGKRVTVFGVVVMCCMAALFGGLIMATVVQSWIPLGACTLCLCIATLLSVRWFRGELPTEETSP